MLKPVLQFLFGKNPDIFDANGHVHHKLPKSKWEAWQDLKKNGATYNWRDHRGTYAGDTPAKPRKPGEPT